MSFTSRFDPATLASIAMLQRLFAWCVLAFFFASGFLHRGDEPVESLTGFARKRARRLLVPCLAFSWAYKIAMLGGASFGIMPSPLSHVPRTAMGWLAEIFTPAIPQFYFLVHLFIVAVGIHALLRLHMMRTEFSRWLLAAIFLQSYWLLPLDRPHGEALSQIPLYSAAYLLGMQFAKFVNDPHRRWKTHALGAALLGISWLTIAIFHQPMLHLVAPLLVVSFASRLPDRVQMPLTFLGRRSGAIYAWHTPIVMPLLSLVLAKSSFSGCPLILSLTLATLAISFALDSTARRFDRHGLFRL